MEFGFVKHKRENKKKKKSRRAGFEGGGWESDEEEEEEMKVWVWRRKRRIWKKKKEEDEGSVGLVRDLNDKEKIDNVTMLMGKQTKEPQRYLMEDVNDV